MKSPLSQKIKIVSTRRISKNFQKYLSAREKIKIAPAPQRALKFITKHRHTASKKMIVEARKMFVHSKRVDAKTPKALKRSKNSKM